MPDLNKKVWNLLGCLNMAGPIRPIKVRLYNPTALKSNLFLVSFFFLPNYQSIDSFPALILRLILLKAHLAQCVASVEKRVVVASWKSLRSIGVGQLTDSCRI